ncbi:MAG TPA: MerR family transcriptional regulator [Aestuariivirgaceae bacterium]|nr:MerR family transcriptional regulator [Aestuariivirgaceae bacterium]
MPFLNPSEAARALGVSVKALRLYEKRGLVAPPRTAAGWRVYGPREMEQVAGIAALRSLGIGLAEIGRVLAGGPGRLAIALAEQQSALEEQASQALDRLARVRRMRIELEVGRTRPAVRTAPAPLAFDLPWPWGGERFELTEIRSLNFIVGPLFSGKTRLARMIADRLPDCAFLGLDRLADASPDPLKETSADSRLEARIRRSLDWLVDDGAAVTPALAVLVTALEGRGARPLVVDMVEQGLDRAAQAALSAYLRHGDRRGGPLFLLTRSSVILDLASLGPDATVILCPANHRPPSLVTPCPGSPGYEAVATCLASPEVRARTEGVVAVRAIS